MAERLEITGPIGRRAEKRHAKNAKRTKMRWQPSAWQLSYSQTLIQIRKELALDRNLSKLVELAKGIHMTDRQRNEQRNSFVYGNTKIENENVTREMVEAISRDIPMSSTE